MLTGFTHYSQIMLGLILIAFQTANNILLIRFKYAKSL